DDAINVGVALTVADEKNVRTVRVRQLRRIGCLLVVQSASIEAAPRIAGEGTRSDQDVDETSTLATSFAPSDDLKVGSTTRLGSRFSGSMALCSAAPSLYTHHLL